MKAISPMIAVILLIAFVVAIGGLISVWFSTLTSSQTGTIETSADALAKCASSTLSVDEVRWASPGSSRIVNVTVVGGGTENLKNITITVAATGGSINSPKFFNGTGDDFIPGSLYSTSINITANVSSLPPEIVTVTGICQNTFSVRGECKAGQDCMKS